ncbi:patatin-like phospholipase family protein [Polynucleobacter sp. MG-6-Vaara-E2]|jgi:NTE family protein|uniref:patatin-like phospholipase family protein n=1 Tax=Polynucleobacter sp. MG-6-Vaara-E2 TaxID=2576932 RepID=UPI001BFE311A|nr:patatin-like phospholipase family protein [Polynucleobacter sp. MG-6-Vaara-E2]QWD97063.1 patatin-like phospholipase family protein [Polynucleobacter sp. MG-6-Vaara-E2]
MTQSSRRNFLKTSTVGAIAVASAPGAIVSSANAQSNPPKSSIEIKANEISKKLFADDGLAIPIAIKPTISNLAKGLDRTMVLGGGGEYYIAWYCGFFHGLYEAGLDMANMPEMVVGTSAGSYIGSSLLSGEFYRLRTEFDFFGKFPEIFSKMAPLATPNLSQMRADKVNMSATDGSIETRRVIGAAALAADNKLNSDRIEKLAALLTGDSKTSWPPNRMYTTGIDCYTGERLVVGQQTAKKNNIALAHGAAASSSLPGVAGPTLLGQRYVMDGGICSNPAHVDLVAGSKRALIITLTNGITGAILTTIPHPIPQNIKDVEATGTKVKWIVAGTPAGVNLLDPKQIEGALRTGYDRAKLEAPKIRDFWA